MKFQITSWLEQIILPSTIIILGLASAGGYIFDSNTLRLVGELSASSPLPIPFTDIEGTQQGFAYKYEIEAISTDGTTVSEELFIKDFIGPHRRTAMYEVAIISWQQSPFIMSGLLSYLCNTTPLFPNLPSDLRSMTLYTTAPSTITASAQSIHVVCPRS